MNASSSNTGSPESGMSKGAAWGIVGVLWLALVINYADRQAIFSIFPVLERDLGFTDAQLGLIGPVFIWVYSVASLVVGRIADVVRRDWLLTASIILWSLSAYGTSLSRSVEHVLFWRAMMGVTEALFFPAAVSMIGSIHSDATRSRAIALYASGQMFGIVLGGWSAGWFADHWGWRPGFVLMAAAGIGYAPVLWFITRRGARVRAEGGAEIKAAGGTGAGVMQMLRARCFWGMALAFFWFCVMLWMLYGWLPKFIYGRFHLSMEESGKIATIFLQASTVAGLVTGGFVTDRVRRHFGPGRFFVSAAGLFLAAPFAWLTLTVESIGLLKISCTCFGFLSGFMITNIFAAPFDVIGRANYGFCAGTLNTIGGLSGGMAMLLVGRLMGKVSIQTLMGYGTIAAMLSAVFMAIFAARHFHRDRARAGLPAWHHKP